MAALEVYYNRGGAYAEAITFYFATDKDFPKLTKDNLAQRLAWDEDHFKKLLSYCEKKKPELFAKEKGTDAEPKK